MTDLFVGQLAETVLDIGHSGKTGMLRVTSAGRLRLAFFEDGKLVYFVSDVPEENLGDFLGRTGRLESAAEQMELSLLEKEVSRKQTLVSLVLERNLVNPDVLREWLVEYAYECLAHAFDTRDGQAKLAPGLKAEHPLPIDVSSDAVILEAVRRMRNDNLVREYIGPLDQMTGPSEAASYLIQTLPLSFYDGLVASQITEEMPIENLVIISGIPEMEVLRALLALRLVGVLAPFKAAKVVSDTDKLRMRLEALESGMFVDASTAAVAFEMALGQDGFDGADSTPITMGEFTGETPYVPPPIPKPPTGPLVAPPPRPRGDTGRLRMISTAYIQMAEAEAAAGNFAAAIQCFESALKQNPKDLDILCSLAKILAKRPSGFANAEKTLRQAIEAHPTKVKPYIELAKLYRENDREDLVETQVAEARRIDPSHPDLKAFAATKPKGEGFFSRLGFRSEQKKSAPAPAATPSGVRQRPAIQQPPSGQQSGAPQRYCRYCGRPSPNESRACRFCGAAL